ncbi:MAG: 6-hydroxycyclohex-1-ene-1-carbonyl-CoA dehydrogenase [Sedimenticola thiotaurini]|uniref:6-hydroxycyclohex-1-ene-1-carbonyl-CoA dehydrogenase n=1 Tax=Sedimenticola thiotaurini TaxID=1543721 RepID=A0A558CZG0_9GAMM|nr:MAG: 6-hydroxycyclohex-1-ene-1-carbonyl-CoA dehydrogenase [Sedimenticola thiotaurini]
MSINGHRWLMTAVGEPFVKEDFTPELPAAGEVTVEVAGCGVCHTDLGFLYDGVRTNHELPLTLGHEISGRVVAAGEGAEALTGKAVVIPAVMPCGECDLCKRGLGTMCRSQKMPGNDIQGGFATHINVPARGLCPVDEKQLEAAGMSLAEVAVLADAVTTPFQAAVLAEINEGDVAIVIGVGGVGGYAVQIANAMGANVIAIDVDQAKLDQLKDFGASLTINAKEHDARAIKKLIKEYVKNNALRATEWKIFECSGSAPGQETAFSLITYGSHLAVVGFTMAKLELRLSNLMAFSARLQGNWGCLPEYYPKALDLVMQNKIQMKPFVKLHSLNDINAVFEAAKNHLLTERAILVPNL